MSFLFATKLVALIKATAKFFKPIYAGRRYKVRHCLRTIARVMALKVEMITVSCTLNALSLVINAFPRSCLQNVLYGANKYSLWISFHTQNTYILVKQSIR